MQDPEPLIDLRPLYPSAKITPPLSSQLPNESQRFWNEVTSAIKEKKFQDATKLKQQLEERQREKAKDREDKDKPFKPRFFTKTLEGSGRPELSEEGINALEGLQAGKWELKEGVVGQPALI